jgi:hypothetical protein
MTSSFYPIADHAGLGLHTEACPTVAPSRSSDGEVEELTKSFPMVSRHVALPMTDDSPLAQSCTILECSYIIGRGHGNEAQ